MKSVGSILIAVATVYGAHRISSAVEYHAERLKPYPEKYLPDDMRGCFPTRKEFEEYKERARQIDSRLPRRDSLPLNYPVPASAQSEG